MLHFPSSINKNPSQESLELLEWPLLCEHLASFASTDKGKKFTQNLILPEKLNDSKILLSQTLEIGNLDISLEGGLSLLGIYDLDHILSRANKEGVLSGEQLLKVANTLSTTRRLRKQIINQQIRPVISDLFKDLSTLPELEKKLRFGLEEGGRISDRASIKLASLRQELSILSNQRKDILNSILRKNSNIFQDSVISNRYERPVLAVKIGFSSQFAGIVHDTSSSGNTVFIEPQSVISLGNSITQIHANILREEYCLLKQWSEDIANNFFQLEHLAEVNLKLDLALTRARYGNWIGGVPAILNKEVDSDFFLKDFRHPLLIWKQRFENASEVIPISLNVSSRIKVIAITGPNTGGKTVTLKSIGLALLMAKAGLLLPCSGNNISLPWCDYVLADIGDEQSIQQNLSTFSGHLRRVKNILEILKKRTGNALVLIDEIGAGTDPTEGAALAISLLKTFAETARLTIATTHLGELKAVKYSDSRFENASVSFDSESMIPTYHLQWGIPGRSNALAIAQKLGLDQRVIDQAQALLAPSKGQEIDQMIVGLEEQRKTQQKSAEEAAVLLARTELLHEELLTNWKRQSEYSHELEKKQRYHLEKSINQAQKEVRDLIRKLRDSGANGETARLVGQRLRDLERENFLTPNERKVPLGWQPVIGDRARIIQLDKVGEILDISQDGLQLTILCGSFRSNISLNNIESIEGEKPRIPDAMVQVKSNQKFRKSSSIRTNTNTIDVRGMRVAEAEVVLEDFFKNFSGPVWVIHGIGTGKLKQGLRQWLKTIPYVEKVLDADQRDGGTGCSIIWLNQ